MASKESRETRADRVISTSLLRRSRCLARSVGHVDDLTVRKPVRGTEPLAVAGRLLARDAIRVDLRALLDDHLALALRVGLHHRDLAIRIDEIAHSVDGEQ